MCCAPIVYMFVYILIGAHIVPLSEIGEWFDKKPESEEEFVAMVRNCFEWKLNAFYKIVCDIFIHKKAKFIIPIKNIW